MPTAKSTWLGVLLLAFAFLIWVNVISLPGGNASLTLAPLVAGQQVTITGSLIYSQPYFACPTWGCPPNALPLKTWFLQTSDGYFGLILSGSLLDNVANQTSGTTVTGTYQGQPNCSAYQNGCQGFLGNIEVETVQINGSMYSFGTTTTSTASTVSSSSQQTQATTSTSIITSQGTVNITRNQAASAFLGVVGLVSLVHGKRYL